MDSVLLLLALFAYGFGSAAFLAHVLTRKKAAAQAGVWALLAGAVLHLSGKAARFVAVGTLPIKDGTDAMSAMALVVAGLFLWASRRYQAPSLGAFAGPLVFVTHAGSLAFGGEPGAVPDALRSAWFPVHIFLAITADAFFAVAGVAAAAFLVQERNLREKKLTGLFRLLPPLHALEEISHRFVMTGVLLLTCGIAAGSLFAKQLWGAYWSWDPKQCFTLVTWLLFAGILHARVTSGWRGRRAAQLTVVAAVAVIVGMVGLTVLFPSRHGGAFDGTKNPPSMGTRGAVPAAGEQP